MKYTTGWLLSRAAADKRGILQKIILKPAGVFCHCEQKTQHNTTECCHLRTAIVFNWLWVFFSKLLC